MMAALVRSLRRLTVSPYFRRAVPGLSYATKPNEGTIATDMEQATGLEKKELDAQLAGEEDPFSMAVHHAVWGTKEKPTVVPSMYQERLVGCICDEDTTFVQWMNLKSGPPQRCECGHWFLLAQGNPTKIQH